MKITLTVDDLIAAALKVKAVHGGHLPVLVSGYEGGPPSSIEPSAVGVAHVAPDEYGVDPGAYFYDDEVLPDSVLVFVLPHQAR